MEAGRNIVALWLGMSWSIFPHYKTDDRPQTAIAIAQAEIDLGKGKSERIGREQGCAVLRVGPGRYEFEAKSPLQE